MHGNQTRVRKNNIASGFYRRFTLSLILAPPVQPHARLSWFLRVIINRLGGAYVCNYFQIIHINNQYIYCVIAYEHNVCHNG